MAAVNYDRNNIFCLINPTIKVLKTNGFNVLCYNLIIMVILQLNFCASLATIVGSFVSLIASSLLLVVST